MPTKTCVIDQVEELLYILTIGFLKVPVCFESVAGNSNPYSTIKYAYILQNIYIYTNLQEKRKRTPKMFTLFVLRKYGYIYIFLCHQLLGEYLVISL